METHDSGSFRRVDLESLETRWPGPLDAVTTVTTFRSSDGQSRKLALGLRVTDNQATVLPLDLVAGVGGTEVLGLSADGTQLLVDSADSNNNRRLHMFDLAPGSLRTVRCDPETNGAGLRGSISPDGRTVGMVALVPDQADPDGEEGSIVVVSIVDLIDQTPRRLFATFGGWGESSGVAWSPDQTSLAATYVAVDDRFPQGSWQTVVIDVRNGKTWFVPGDDVTLASQGNGAWLDDRTLICQREDGTQTIDTISAAAGPIISDRQFASRIGNTLLQMKGLGPVLGFTLAGTEKRPWLEVTSSAGEQTKVEAFPSVIFGGQIDPPNVNRHAGSARSCRSAGIPPDYAALRAA